MKQISLLRNSTISLKDKLLLGLLLITNLFFINGCAFISHGRMEVITQNQVDVIKIGVSTKEDIIEKFGEPQQTVYKPDGVEAFVYIHGVERSIGIPFLLSLGRAGGTGQTLSISFKEGVVIDYEFAIDQRKIGK